MTKKQRNFFWDLFISIIAIALGLIIVFPIIYCICGAFKTPSEFMNPTLLPKSFTYLENFRDALEKGDLLRYGLNSFIIALIGSSVRLILATLAAYVFTFFDFPGKNFCFFAILGTMMIPGDVLISTNYLTISRLHLLNTYLACMMVSFVGASQMFLLRQKFMTVPKSMREAANLDGYSDTEFIWSILLPVCKTELTTLFIQSFTTLWNAYLWPLIVTASSPKMRTIMVGITKLNSWEDDNYQLVLAGVCISLVPSLILFILMRRNNRKKSLDGGNVG